MSESMVGNTNSIRAANRRKRCSSKCPAPYKCRSSGLYSMPPGQLAKFTHVSDVYRTVLGPTSDETILAGLQTVMDMCLTSRQLPDDSQSEYSTDTNYSGRSSGITNNSEKRLRSTACMTEGRCNLQCMSVWFVINFSKTVLVIDLSIDC